MKPRRRNRLADLRPAYTLVQLMVMLPLAALLLLILGRLILDTMYVQRVAAQHTNLMLVEDSLLAQLRQDASAATAVRGDPDAVLTLELADPAGATTITYEITPTVVWRRAAGGDERSWSCWRLQFGTQIEPGPRAALLALELIETPPPRRSAVLPRTYVATVLLPHFEAQTRPSTDGEGRR